MKTIDKNKDEIDYTLILYYGFANALIEKWFLWHYKASFSLAGTWKVIVGHQRVRLSQSCYAFLQTWSTSFLDIIQTHIVPEFSSFLNRIVFTSTKCVLAKKLFALVPSMSATSRQRLFLLLTLWGCVHLGWVPSMPPYCGFKDLSGLSLHK